MSSYAGFNDETPSNGLARTREFSGDLLNGDILKDGWLLNALFSENLES